MAVWIWIIVACWGLVSIGLLGFEYQYRQRAGNNLACAAGEWNLEVFEPNRDVIVGQPTLINRTPASEIMTPELTVKPTLLSENTLDGIRILTRVTPQHSDAEARADGYWFAYIVKLRKTTQFRICVEIEGADLTALRSLWVQVNYITYGPQGRIPKTGHVVVPLWFPKPDTPLTWKTTAGAKVLPRPTHLLTHLDDPVAVIKRYITPHAQPGDIITLGETPLAIMQGRWRHPKDIHPGWLAQRLCYYFLPTSSLATACGLQSLVDLVGPWRVSFAFVIGALAKGLLRIPGVFYRLAGEQARLIDDVTGTLPPYDQFIILGPHAPGIVVRQIHQATGFEAAIVDANDLKVVKVLAATPNIDSGTLTRALQENPAGNADEQTPLVLVRPSSS